MSGNPSHMTFIRSCKIRPNKDVSMVPQTKDAWLKTFGANVRRERVALKLSQARFAEMADLSTRNLQKLEAAQFTARVTTAARIQKALGCPWEKLIPE